MSKLKLILCTMAIFMISAVGCFADSVDSLEEQALSKKYVIYKTETTIYYTDDLSYYLGEDGYVRIRLGEYYRCLDGVYYEPLSGAIINCKYATIYGTNDVGLTSFLEENGITLEGDFVPPQVTPIQGAVQTIVPQFSEQLKSYLPTCITILAILLGVSLVPRIIHFLV